MTDQGTGTRVPFDEDCGEGLDEGFGQSLVEGMGRRLDEEDGAGCTGYVAEGFEEVADAFRTNLRERGDTGAAVCVYHRGAPVVDLVGGCFRRDSVQVIRSASKGVVAVLAHVLAQRGDLDFDMPVAEVWPEFGQEGKGRIPVRWLFTHQAGVTALDRGLTVEDILGWAPAAQAVAAQRPNWEPGTAHGYHDLTYGWLTGEVLRRLTGRTVGALVRRELAEPLGLDLWIGLPPEVRPRLTKTLPAPPPSAELRDDRQAKALREALADPGSFAHKALLNPDIFDVEHTSAYLSAEVPAANGVSDARSLARLYAAVVGEVDGVRLLSDDAVRAAATEQARGVDRVVGYFRRYATGFMLPDPTRPMGGLDTACFGHYGMGGSVAFADPEHTLGFGYTTVQDQAHVGADPRSRSLAEAAWRCAARRAPA
ncbi:serine hydrolase domain-containing protein [Streptomyces phaeofaciens]|uniref:serine hydrolase domain-containing protein n=1 Tax=Streptomyces phaeofaciens TaxID=68254 RepID=UPI00369AFAA6